MRAVLVAARCLVISGMTLPNATQLRDASDRAALSAWFVFLADAQYYRPTADVADCAGLVRHALREALRPHTPGWVRAMALPVTPALPEVRHPLSPTSTGWPLFATADGRRAEFADARTIIGLNCRSKGRERSALAPGDLLYFRQSSGDFADHLMVFVGASLFDRTANDWIVYHTGPDGSWPGEVRKVRLADLERHPSPRWRPFTTNPVFVGLFRLVLL